MKTLLNCSQSGLFHQHNVDNIYTDASKPGHVHELPGLEFQIVDQRP
jgi:STAM-binding protein